MWAFFTKAVILADENTVKSEAYFRSFGKFVEAMGGRYITAEDAMEIPDNLINNYLGRNLSKRELRNWKRDFEMTWRNVLVDQAMHATPEPDGAVRAFMHQGAMKGTMGGEIARFLGQFKAFPVSIWKKIIGREMKSYGPEEGALARITGGHCVQLQDARCLPEIVLNSVLEETCLEKYLSN